jgi:DNA polymerase-1
MDKEKGQVDSKRLVLIDGNAIMHRAYHALPPLTGRNGQLLNAVYGFTTMLFKVINDLKPHYLIVAFDTGKPTFRQAEYLGYQSKRPHMDEELSGQFPLVLELLEAMGIPVMTKEGFEADDVIGTLARKAAKGKNQVDEVVIVSGDRDLLQLVNDKTKIFMPVKGISEAELVNPERVKEKMGVPPESVVDFKGLTGDASDNYPGVPGIGPKTAIQLLEKYKTIDNLYRNLENVRKEFGENIFEKLKEGEDLAKLSRKLATIIVQVPVEFNPQKSLFEFREKEREKIIKKLEEWRFKSIIERLKPKKTARGKNDLQERLF